MRGRLAFAVMVMAAVIGGLLPVFVGVGYWVADRNGIVAAIVSLLVVGLPALASLVITAKTSGGTHRLAGGLSGTLLRPLVAIGSLLWLTAYRPELIKARVSEMILVWYLILLLVETVVVVRTISPPKASA